MDTKPPDTDAEAPAAPEPQEPPRRRRRVRRVVVRLAAVVLAVVVAALLTGLTVDLGPAVRKRAEAEGSKYLRRPLHIGRVSARLIPGVFVFEDLMIEGLTPKDRPFLTAKKVTVRLPVVDDRQPPADRRVRRHDRLAHGRRDVRERPSQLPARDARAQGPSGSEAVHHHGQGGPRRQRAVHLRRPRHAVEHGRPAARGHAVSQRRLQRLSRARLVRRTARSRSSPTSRSARPCAPASSSPGARWSSTGSI